jgi:fluoride exporter
VEGVGVREGDPWVEAELPVDPDVDLHRDPAPARVRREWPVLAAIALGGGLGSVARELVGRAWPTAAGGFPWGTFLVNVSGSFGLGIVLVLVLQVWRPGRYARPFLAVGFLGGFTTFSTFAAEIHGLLERGRWALGDGYAIGSVLAGLAAVWLGMAATRRLAAGERPAAGAADTGRPEAAR